MAANIGLDRACCRQGLSKGSVVCQLQVIAVFTIRLQSSIKSGTSAGSYTATGESPIVVKHNYSSPFKTL